MRRTFMLLGFLYLALAVVSAIFLGISFFKWDCNPPTQLTLLMQSAGFGFVSGLYFGRM